MFEGAALAPSVSDYVVVLLKGSYSKITPQDIFIDIRESVCNVGRDVVEQWANREQLCRDVVDTPIELFVETQSQ